MVLGTIPEVPLVRLGAKVNILTAEQVAAWIANGKGQKRLLLNHNLHSLYVLQTDRDFRALYEISDLTVVDGMPILLAASWAQRRRIPSEFRVGSTDWIGALAGHIPLGFRVFMLGASRNSNDAAIDALRDQLPRAVIAGCDGYQAESVALAQLAAFKPDLVAIGMGMPMQEHVLLRNWDVLYPATYATVGGAIDYVAGQVKLAPRWLGSIGLEWVWRLAHDPRRLAGRYLVEPLRLGWILLSSTREPRPRRNEGAQT